MDLKTHPLVKCGTGNSSLFSHAHIVVCISLITLKYNPNGSSYCLKASLVTCGFNQAYDIDCTEIFSSMVKLEISSSLFGGSSHMSLH